LKLANLIIRLTGSKSRLAFKGLPKDDPKVRRPDIARARKRLGWLPKINLEEGLSMTIDYFKTTPKT
ncbi:MAG: SDR family NAD-dependent epimerase/dehydratase, partial [Candidatus Omnitrophica bacterium]|nr:SDR family NAD-dependent epimerase/dehydratase [Candidatus Omnitrophota bacterium]